MRTAIQWCRAILKQRMEITQNVGGQEECQQQMDALNAKKGITATTTFGWAKKRGHEFKLNCGRSLNGLLVEGSQLGLM